VVSYDSTDVMVKLNDCKISSRVTLREDYGVRMGWWTCISAK